MPGYKFSDMAESGEIMVESHGVYGITTAVLIIKGLGIISIEKFLQNHLPKGQRLLSADQISSNGRIIKGTGEDNANTFEWYMSVPNLLDLETLKKEGIDKFFNPNSRIKKFEEQE